MQLFEDTKDQRLTSEGLAIDCEMLKDLSNLFTKYIEQGLTIRETEYMLQSVVQSCAVNYRLKARVHAKD